MSQTLANISSILSSMQGFIAGMGSAAGSTVSGLNPFSIPTAHAPSSREALLPTTQISAAGQTNQAYNAGFGAGYDFGNKAIGAAGAIGLIVPLLGEVDFAVNLSTIQLNRLKGAAFEEQTYANLQGELKGTVRQVTVTTDSGVNTRIDIAGRDASGNVCLVECKSSVSAPLTPNQAAAFPEIEQSGGTVAGQGKEGFPGGMRISPTKVIIIRP